MAPNFIRAALDSEFGAGGAGLRGNEGVQGATPSTVALPRVRVDWKLARVPGPGCLAARLSQAPTPKGTAGPAEGKPGARVPLPGTEVARSPPDTHKSVLSSLHRASSQTGKPSRFFPELHPDSPGSAPAGTRYPRQPTPQKLEGILAQEWSRPREAAVRRTAWLKPEGGPPFCTETALGTLCCFPSAQEGNGPSLLSFPEASSSSSHRPRAERQRLPASVPTPPLTLAVQP